MRASLDLAIAGFHKQVFTPADIITNTDAMIAVMASGKVHIISHPGNPEYPIDIPAVVAAAKARHVALEVKNTSVRQVLTFLEQRGAKHIPELAALGD